MPKFAQFDPAVPSPQPVIGWYDTDFANYPNLPPQASLLQLTQAQWDGRFATAFVQNGKLVAAPAPSADQLLADAQAVQISKLETAYSAAIQIPVAYIGTTFQADIASQDTLAKSLVAGSVPVGFYWLDALNTKVPMTFAQLQGLAVAMLAQGQAAFDRLQTRKAAVRSASTVAAVQVVVW